MRQRHRWIHHDVYTATCAKCGTKALKRPHPYRRYWFTEWHLPDGSYITNYNGDPTPPTPPCPPIQQAPETTALGTAHS